MLMTFRGARFEQVAQPVRQQEAAQVVERERFFQAFARHLALSEEDRRNRGGAVDEHVEAAVDLLKALG